MPKRAFSTEESAIRHLLAEWARATREGRREDVLRNHHAHVLIYDVLPPFQYTSAAEYRESWDAWQPEAQGEVTFELEDLEVTAGSEVAFAHGALRCGGTLPDGKSFREKVRATFCFAKGTDRWQVTHQHISKEFRRG